MANHAKPNMPGKYQQGYYALQNPDKYVGNPSEIVYRSSYEKRFCAYCDLNPNITKWGSEVNTVPYMAPDGNQRRYHVDFYLELEDKNVPEGMRKLLIEVKPSNEVSKPKKPKKNSLKALKNYEYSLKTYQKNLCKWSAAKEYAENRGMKFVIVSEKHLNKIR